VTVARRQRERSEQCPGTPVQKGGVKRARPNRRAYAVFAAYVAFVPLRRNIVAAEADSGVGRLHVRRSTRTVTTVIASLGGTVMVML